MTLKLLNDDDLTKYDGLHCSFKLAAYLEKHPMVKAQLLKLSPTNTIFRGIHWPEDRAYIMRDGNLVTTIIIEGSETH